MRDFERWMVTTRGGRYAFVGLAGVVGVVGPVMFRYLAPDGETAARLAMAVFGFVWVFGAAAVYEVWKKRRG